MTEAENIARAYSILRKRTDPDLHPLLDSLERLHEVDRLATSARKVYTDALEEAVLGDNTQFSRKAGLRAVDW